MLTIVIIFFLASIYLYCLLGGADFGAGIVELFSRKEKKEITKDLVTKAIAPVWEANHMWLIIAVVILFMGFPKIYTTVSIALYIPLILLLVGIVFRGCAFTFRHYDAFKDFSQNIYSRVFEYSSLMVIFFFGLITGALVSGKIIQTPSSFVEAYLSPWLNLFSISIGIFLCALLAFIASVFLIGDTKDNEKRSWLVRKSKRANLITIAAGGMVFLSSYLEDIPFTAIFFESGLSILLILAATLSIPVLFYVLNNKMVWASRIAAGGQLLFILGAFYAAYYPTIVIIKDGQDLTLFNSAAPDATLAQLGWALLIGSIFILPALIYLMKIFKASPEAGNLKN